MAESRWLEAAQYFDEYAKIRPLDWEAHFSRAVAYANSREGTPSNVAALRAISDALALAPSTIDQNLRARLFTYRGALLKRLRRLEEAETDLTIALKTATHQQELDDIRYNLAGVYAMRGDRQRLLEMVRMLKHSPKYLMSIRSHLHDYFQNFSNDREFVQTLSV